MLQTINEYRELVKKAINIYRILNKYYLKESKFFFIKSSKEYLSLHKRIFSFNVDDCNVVYNSVGIVITQTKQRGLTETFKTIPFKYFSLSNSELKEIASKTKNELEKTIEERIKYNQERKSILLKAVQTQMVFINLKYQEKNLKKKYRNCVIKLVDDVIVLEKEGCETIKLFKFNSNRATFVEISSLSMVMSPKIVNFILTIVRDVTKEMRTKIDY